MSQSELYATNVHRGYPLVTDNEVLFPLLSGIKVVVRPSVRYRHGRDRVVLQSYGFLSEAQAAATSLPTGPFAIFEFKCKTPVTLVAVAAFGSLEDFSDVDLQFFDKNALQAAMTLPEVETAERIRTGEFSGWCTLGISSEFGAGWEHTDAALEPTTVFATPELGANTGLTYVYNQRTTQFDYSNECQHLNQEVSLVDEYQLLAGSLGGSIQLKGGRQGRINQRFASKQIEIIADGTPGEGGKLCTPVDVTPGVSDSDTAPRCNDVLRTINGIEGPTVEFSGGTGVAVEPHPNLNRLVVDIGTRSLKVCTGNADELQVEYLPTNDAGQKCGDHNTDPPTPGVPDGSTGYSITITPAPAPSAQPTGGNRCLWKGVSGDWELMKFPCKSPRACSKPSTPPENEDDLIAAPCLTVPLNAGEWIRNGDFTHASIPSAAWDFSDNVVVVNELAGVISNLFPMAAFTAGERSPANIFQRGIVPVEGLYALQAYVYMPSGRMTFVIKNDVSGKVQHTFELAENSSEVKLVAFGPFRLDVPIASLTVTYSSVEGDIALAGIFALVDQNDI